MGHPRAWRNQLTPAGRIVVPVRLHGSGLTRSLALDLQPTGELLSSFVRVCGFMPMRGDTVADTTTAITLADQVTLNTAASDNPDTDALARALTHPARPHWTGIIVTDHEPAEHLDLWLATATHRFGRLAVSADARRTGIAEPALRWGGASIYDNATLVYLTVRPHGPISSELGIVAHGPDSQRLTARLVELLHAWNHTRPARPVITAHQAATPDDQPGAGIRIDRPETRFTLTW